MYGQHHVSGGAKIDRARERGQGGRLHQRDSGRIVKAGLLRPGFGGQAQLVQRGVHFKVRQQACGGRGVRRVFFVCAGCGVYGRAAHDLGQRAAHPGLFFVPQQLFPHAFFDARVVDVFIHACQRAEILNEGKGCFFTHSRDAGNDVRRVAHQAFHLDELAGPDAVVTLRPIWVPARSTRVWGPTSCRLSLSPVAMAHSSPRAAQAAASVPRISSAS